MCSREYIIRFDLAIIQRAYIEKKPLVLHCSKAQLLKEFWGIEPQQSVSSWDMQFGFRRFLSIGWKLSGDWGNVAAFPCTLFIYIQYQSNDLIKEEVCKEKLVLNYTSFFSPLLMGWLLSVVFWRKLLSSGFFCCLPWGELSVCGGVTEQSGQWSCQHLPPWVCP